MKTKQPLSSELRGFALPRGGLKGLAPLLLGVVAIMGWPQPLWAALPGVTTIISNEALVNMPSDTVSNRWINIRPGNGDVVTINPPIFSWLYEPNPAMRQSDRQPWWFQFQVAYDNTFSSPVVNVTTKGNMYNFLAPFGPGPVFWRVGYINPSTGATNSWSDVRSFTIAGNAMTWDRSKLADTNYLLGKSHPRILFNSQTLPQVQAAYAQALASSSSQQSANTFLQEITPAMSTACRTISENWLFGTNIFTIDFWVNFNGAPAGATALMSSTASASDNWSICLNASSQLTIQFTRAGTVQASYTTSNPLNVSPNTWHHLAFQRNGSAGLIFVDGVSQNLTASPGFGANDISETYAPLLIGRCPGTSDFKGWMDEIRIEKGIVRWTGNFAVPTADYAASTYDVLLLELDWTSTSASHPTAISDSTGNPKTVVCNGNAQLTQSPVVFGTASVVFGGNGDYLQVNDYWQGPYSIPLSASGTWPGAVNQMPMLLDLALAYCVTGSNCFLLGTNLAFATGQLALDAINAGYVNGYDDFQGGTVDILGMVYDWLYSQMTPTERSNVVRAVELNCSWALQVGQGGSTQGWWYDTSKQSGANWTLTFNNQGLDESGAGKQGLGHPWANWNYAMEGALGVYSESTNQDLWDMFNIGMNYMLAKDYPFSDDTGSGLNTGVEYAFNGMQRNTPKALYFHSAFPDVGFNRNPIYTNLAAWFDWMLPVGFMQANWPWGDTGTGRTTEWISPMALGWPLTALSGSGRAYTHWQNQLTVYSNWAGFSSKPNDPLCAVAIVANNLTTPGPDTSSTAQWFPEGGWVMGATYPPDTFNCFTNGVGFIFQARPGGDSFEHDHNSDLSFQLWAYGSVITDAGGGFGGMNPYAKVPQSHYSLLVNGLGEGQPTIQSNSYFNQMLAYETTSNFTYALADGTAAYPNTKFNQSSGWLYPTAYLNESSGGPLIGLTKVQRHFLFMRQQGYFIIYDDLADNQPVTFTWLYHILENTLSLNTNAMTFTYTSDTQALALPLSPSVYNAKWPPVTVYVAHISNPQNLQVADMSGNNVRSNPITGDNYWSLGDSFPRAHALWFSNKSPTTSFHFMTVIYPVPQGAPAPQITRVDDYTVQVSNGSQTDIVSFENNPPVTPTLVVSTVGLTPTIPTTPGGIAAPANLHIVYLPGH